MITEIEHLPATSSRFSSSDLGRIAGITLAVTGVGALGLILFARVCTDGLESHPCPATSYDEAMQRFTQLQALDGDDVNPVCQSTLLTHGHRTERSIVLIHGITNCPQQYVALAPLFYEQGYNVLIPRMPRNGLADIETDDLKHLTAEELREYADTIVDIARGLGDQVTVAGLSAGGVIAAWVAQFRDDVDKAVVMAPSLSILPSIATRRLNLYLKIALFKLFLRLPNIMTQGLKPFREGPTYAYIGHSTRALAQVMRLGLAVFRASTVAKPATPSVLVVLNENDAAIDGSITELLVKLWQNKGVRHLETHTFPAELNLEHDLIDPNQKMQHTDLVYPVLLDLIIR